MDTSIPREREVGFVKPSINYGSVPGSAAKFFGQGLLNLKKASSAAISRPPFDMVLRASTKTSYFCTIAPGTLNGMLAQNYASCYSNGLTVTEGMLILLNVTSDGRQISSYTITATPTPVQVPQPTSPLAPTTFKWPIGIVLDGQVKRLIGNSSLVARAVETVRQTKSIISDIASPGYDSFYSWIVSNSLL